MSNPRVGTSAPDAGKTQNNSKTEQTLPPQPKISPPENLEELTYILTVENSNID